SRHPGESPQRQRYQRDEGQAGYLQQRVAEERRHRLAAFACSATAEVGKEARRVGGADVELRSRCRIGPTPLSCRTSEPPHLRTSFPTSCHPCRSSISRRPGAVVDEVQAAEVPRASRISAAALLLGASVLLSRVLGYAREALLAYRVGAGASTDAY